MVNTEIPTVEEAKPLMESYREEMLSYLREDPLTDTNTRWKKQYTKKNVLVTKWLPEGSKFDFFRGDAVVDLTMDEIWEYAVDDSKRYDWDRTNTKDIHTVEEFKPEGEPYGLDVIYLRFRSPTAFISPRDSLMLRTLGKSDDDSERWAVLTSVKVDSHPPVKGVVRGVVMKSALMFKKMADGKVRITYIFMSDPVGSVPYALAKMKLGEQAECVGAIRDAAVKQFKK
ncbi:START domain [Carpediemonas membranifera]|uniref:START domain n=1 Tax=Carpediemonas membranifera TaxID=201153 RepID=A0A8J6E0M5_9EUKA|nr:START domain [Carpediemonas membranifera]|eukprot:KAG9392423.1 START domain [Carpediemonas membranifera]